MTYGFTNCQQPGKCSMDFSFCQFSQVDIVGGGGLNWMLLLSHGLIRGNCTGRGNQCCKS